MSLRRPYVRSKHGIDDGAAGAGQTSTRQPSRGRPDWGRPSSPLNYPGGPRRSRARTLPRSSRRLSARWASPGLLGLGAGSMFDKIAFASNRYSHPRAIIVTRKSRFGRAALMLPRSSTSKRSRCSVTPKQNVTGRPSREAIIYRNIETIGATPVPPATIKTAAHNRADIACRAGRCSG